MHMLDASFTTRVLYLQYLFVSIKVLRVGRSHIDIDLVLHMSPLLNSPYV